MTQPIIIKGKLARQIFEQILSKDRAMQLSNIGTEQNPVLQIGEW